MPKPKIKDIAVVTSMGRDYPVGEAPRGKILPPMTSGARTYMEDRLFRQISDLMDEANSTHLANCKLPGTDQVDPDYITRLSTNEFFFYTQEPLTLEEFERLQDKIADKAATLPSGVQLVLGSFAVKNADNQVMNVTPHITCGPSPSMHFIIKSNTSSIDVRYKEPTADGSGDTLPVFDATKPSLAMPEIKVKGVSQPFAFNNVIPCKTPGGEPFLTAVDICLDHLMYTAKSNIDAFVQGNPAAGSLPISHMVVSNWVNIAPLSSYGTVMHVDPHESETKCKADVNQVEKPMTNAQQFGEDPFIAYELDTTPCQTLQEVYDQYPAKLFAKLETLKFGAHDLEMDRFIEDKKQAFQAATTLESVQKMNDGLLETVHQLESNPAIMYVQSTINDYRKKAGLLTVGMENKANRIQSAMGQVPISERCHFAQSIATRGVMRELASHRHWGKQGEVYLNKRGEIDVSRAAESYKGYRKAFGEIRKRDEAPKPDEQQDETKKPGM